MVRLVHQRVLLIGDPQREVHGALLQALPGVQVTTASTVFDGIAELASAAFSAVLAPAEPIERRPEAAVRSLRELAGDCRLVLFGHPTLELLARKMLEFGCDDYIITPPDPVELKQMLGAPPLRLAESAALGASGPDVSEDLAAPAPPVISVLERLPLSDIMLDAQIQHPQDAPSAAVRTINTQIAPELELRFLRESDPPPEIPDGRMLVSHPTRATNDEMGVLHLFQPAGEDEVSARHALSRISQLIGKLAGLQDRHNGLQRLAITDELTGLYNARYFRHFLTRIIERARVMRFTVTLLLFDIDNFKRYNDKFGHGVGDEILRESATLMSRCTRDHDLVARIGGDEFAVVFWEKEGPRQPRDPNVPTGSRPPHTPLEIFKRFKRLIETEDFVDLGSSGRGKLGISAGMASFPWNATDAASLIKAADEGLMFGAKQGGKNSIYLVGGNEPSA